MRKRSAFVTERIKPRDCASLCLFPHERARALSCRFFPANDGMEQRVYASRTGRYSVGRIWIGSAHRTK